MLKYRIYSNKYKYGAYLFEGGAYLKSYQKNLLFLYFYLTVHFKSVNFSMDWY